MRPTRFVLASLAGAAVAATLAIPSALARSDARLHGRHGGGVAYFAVLCGFSHMNNDDPIVFPGQPGRSHHHTFFGNTSTNASSTPASLRASRSTTCRLRADTAAYWAPTLHVGSRAIEPLGAVVYYVRRTTSSVEPFPQGLQMIAGNAAATSPQSLGVTSWSCGIYGGARASSTVPNCLEARRANLRLQVNFPNCWNGRTLDNADHKGHMAYSVDGRCPATHPVAVPALLLRVVYPVAGGANASLASGGQFSAHADFVNAWDQDVLRRLVDRYLNRVR